MSKQGNASSFGSLMTARSQLSGAGGSGGTYGTGMYNGVSFGKDKHWYHRELFRFLLKLRAVRPEHGIPGLAQQQFTSGFIFGGGGGGAGGASAGSVAVGNGGSGWVTTGGSLSTSRKKP